MTGPETLLIVEDEELVRLFVSRALSGAGYEVLVAADGVEALELLERRASPVDLIVTDVVMPRMRGPALAERVRRLHPKTPVLFISGYVEGPEDAESILTKPFQAAELNARVRALLDRARSARESDS